MRARPELRITTPDGKSVIGSTEVMAMILKLTLYRSERETRRRKSAKRRVG